MARYINRNQLKKASDEEIIRFFEETIFEGIYSSEIKSKNSDFYKGSITDIKLEGRTTNLAPFFLNVPRSSNRIPEGPCSFKCKINIEAFREDPSRYILNLAGKSLASIEALSAPNINVSSKHTKEQELFDMWGVDNCQCIGFYHYDEESEIYVVDDLRKPNFDHIPYYPGDAEKKPIRITYPHEIRGIKPNDYYLFTWKLSHRNTFNPYEIFLDFSTQPRPIDPKWFIDTLFDDRHNDKSKNFGSATNFLDTLSKQLSAKESTFVYELLQNANDYPVEGKMVDVEFHITDNYLLFLHSGEKFNVRNISGICGINEKEKTANKKTIGYKGIGFKTVFLQNHYVYLRTGDYSFRFDEGETPEKKVGGKIRRLGAPFQILPIWTGHNEVATEVNEVFDNVNKKFQVKIALRPNDKKLLHVGSKSYENLFREVFSDSNIILFIPNINSVRVFINGKEEKPCVRNNDEWIVGDYEQDIDFDLQELVNKTIEKGNSRIPEKYKDFECTKVSFACKHKGAMIEPIEKSILYCYLPTSASWGFPFLMNTDMIPKGDRNDIEKEVTLVGDEEKNFNKELATIAGMKFFDWIKDLLTSKNYQLGSVFSLIPDFKKCIKEHDFYDDYIKKFAASFDECLENDQIVPVHQGIANIKKVILDTTGLTTSGILTDEEFYKFSGMEDSYLPLPMLRKDKHFNSFLKRYADDEQKFTEDNLPDLIANSDFQEWLSVQENNDKFLNFLLEKGYLENLLEEEIFLEAEGNLYSSSDLFYDIDEFLVDLRAFENHILYLSPKTREFFKDNQKWADVIDGAFADFDCDSFIDDVLLDSDNLDETVKRLHDKDTSIHFYKFLAENVGFGDSYMELPFINDKGEVVDSFEDRFIFFSSEKGHQVCEASWLSPVDIEFISNDYTKETLNYFTKNFSIRDFSDEIIINEIILSDDYKKEISDEIEGGYDVSKDFVNYCFSHKSLFNTGSLNSYSLKVYDGDGDEQWYIAEGDVFFPSSRYDYYAGKSWLGSSWMVALENDYFKDISDKEDFKQFISDAFGVEELTESNFYLNIVKPNIDDILTEVSGDNDPDGSRNIDFVKYLDENYNLIFEENRDAELFSSFNPVSTDDGDLNIDETVYIYDEELAQITEYDWFPEDLIYLCSKEYGNSPALKAIGCKQYNYSDFYDDVLVGEISTINDNIDTVEKSVDFHNFIISNLRGLTTDQQEKMTSAKVFLYGGEESDEAGGHKTLSAKAKELFDKKLVEFSDLDIIDPLYNTDANTEYWETRLGNTKFTVTHFFVWLKDNADTFSETIRDESLNVVFWRWVKGNVTISDKLKEDIPALPILINGDEFADCSDAIYFSDAYLDGKSLETYVKRFDENALFLSPAYILEGDKLDSWLQFWTKIGIKQEVLDVIIETIIPSLSDIEDESLPRLFAENREKLEEHYGDEFISQLTDLRVKGRDGNFYPLDECIYIDCEKDEPFTYIELPNQISFNTGDERRLIKELIEECDGDCVSTLSEWQQRKVDRYLEMQNEDEDSIRDFHYQFINDLSVIRNTSTESLKEIERIKEIYLLNKDNEFCSADTLTMGSVYNPFFDFEKCEIDELDYVSNEYNEKSSEYTGRLFRSLGMHCDFKKDDIDFLEQRICAVYFWNSYLTKTGTDVTSIVEMIDGHLLDDISCIPTKDYMKTPGDLYYGEEVSRYVKSIEDWENKIPLKDLPEIKLSDGSTIFEKLPFKESLDFLDALYALVNIKGQDRRTQLLYWMIDTYDEEYDEVINEYREDEHSTWLNTKNEPVQIKELYALDYWNKSLEQYFGSNNPRIINKNYLPAGDSFKEACDILGIMTICAEDLVMVPENDTIFTQRNRALKLFALVIAGKIDLEGWQDRYNEYSNRLETLTLHRCSSIKISYKEDESINQTLKKFYHEKGSDDFYFVKSLDDKRVFQYFVKEYMEYLGIKNDEIALELVEDIMDSEQNALDLVKADNFLMIDDDYKNELEVLVPEIRRELSGNMAVEDEDDSVVYRPSFTTVQNDEEDETNDGIVDEDDSAENNELGNYQEKTSSSDVYNFDEEDDDELAESEDTKDNKNNSTEYSSHRPEEHHPSTSRRQIPDYQKPEEYNDIEGDARQEAYGIPSNNNSPQSSSNSSDSSEDSHSSSIDSGQTSKTSNTEHHRQSEKSRSEDNAPHPHSHNDYRPHSETADIPTPKYNPIDELAEEKEKQIFQLEEGDAGSDELAHNDELFEGGLTREEIYDQSTLVKTRVFNDFKEHKLDLEMSEVDFIRKTRNKTNFVVKTKSGTYVHVKSAFNGILYLSPTFWNRVQLETAVVCVILSHKAKNFLYIRNHEDLEKLIGGDQIFVKVKGADKIGIVNQLFGKSLTGAKEKVYTMLRVKTGGKLDYLFQPARSEWDDDEEEQYIDNL